MQNVPPQDQAAYAQLLQQLAQVPPSVRAAIAAQTIASQKSVLPFPYFSKVRLQAVKTGADPNQVYTIPVTPVVAFNYQIGGVLDGAGFLPAGTIATKAETNILSASQTRNNSDVVIWGIGVEIGPKSEPILVKEVFDQCNMDMSLNGQNTNQLGRLSRFPSAGGIYGSAVSRLTPAPQQQTWDNPQGFLCNGNPMAGNYFKLPQPIFWNSVGGQKKDSSLSVTITPQRAITYTQEMALRAAVAGGANTSGTAAWNLQQTANANGTFVDLIIHLICVEVSQRSESI